MIVYAVYAKQIFYGYSTSFGTGNEEETLLKVFKNHSSADQYIAENQNKALSHDEEWFIKPMDVSD